MAGFEPTSVDIKNQSLNHLATFHNIIDLGRIELPTKHLSGEDSNH